jgi:hypothetical protein
MFGYNPSMLILAQLLVMLTSVGLAVGQTGQNPTVERRAIEAVQRMPAATLSRELPKERFVDWFRKTAGPSAVISWEINDCGEQTGDPSQVADLPFCVEATATKGVRSVGVLVAVGTKKRGLFPVPQVFYMYAKSGKETKEIRTLAELPAFLKP